MASGFAVQPGELGLFAALAAGGSLSAAARALGVSTAAVSKRLAQMETRLGVALVNRTTRRMSLTPEGETYLAHARRILGEIEELERQLGRARGTPSGLLRVHATPGFGRRVVAPLISQFVRRYPQVEVQLTLAADPPPADEAFDVCIRFGAPPQTRMVARLIARNRRLLVAAPAYLARHGEPRLPAELARHNCIGIRQGDEAHGTWRWSATRRAGPAKRSGHAEISAPAMVKSRCPGRSTATASCCAPNGMSTAT